jgi:anti-anti-sigma regulatory factor
MDVRLEVIEGLHLGTLVPVQGPRFLIGRDPKCQLRPKSPAVSGIHCAIIIEDEQVRIQDLGSTNGTLVNDRCLRQGEVVRVKDGDRLQVAQLSFKFRITAAGSGNGRPAHKDSEIVDWVTAPDAASAPNPVGRTMLLGSLEPAVSRPASLGLEKVRPPGPQPDSATLFAFRAVDPVTKATCFGISPLQLTAPEDVRALRRALQEWSERSPPSVPRRLVLDLSAVEALPGSIYALLHALSGHCRQLGGEVRLCAASPEVRHWLTALHLQDVIPCYEDRTRALSDPWE